VGMHDAALAQPRGSVYQGGRMNRVRQIQ
jgi:hypothetical protein